MKYGFRALKKNANPRAPPFRDLCSKRNKERLDGFPTHVGLRGLGKNRRQCFSVPCIHARWYHMMVSFS